MNRRLAWCLTLPCFAGLAALALAADSAAPKPADAAKPADIAVADIAVERSRKTVKMLDDVYKQTIVMITDKYVHDTDDFAAGSAAVLLFKNVSKSGMHNVRLLDATDEPYEAENVAKDAFEKEGIKRIKAGEAYYDQVEEKDGKRHLRAMTSVPVVMDKCIMCHSHYAEAKEKGQAIGAISYTVPVE